jgi:protein gp37
MFNVNQFSAMYKTNIRWCTYTHNFWSGCKKVSEGCKYCYMYRIEDKKKIDPTEVRKGSDFREPLASKFKKPELIFTCSMSDFFIEDADQWRPEAWEIIKDTPQHTWLILTKRPERIKDCLPPDWGDGYPNVWLGISVENNKNLHRLNSLAEIPCKLRFISAEPLLETIDFTQEIDGKTPIDAFEWIILGGESGDDYGKYRYRECREKWIYETFAPLLKMGKYVFVKQVGTFVSKNDPKQKGKQDRHGTYMNLWSKAIQIQEVPPWKTLETNGFSKVQMGQIIEKTNYEAFLKLESLLKSKISQNLDDSLKQEQIQAQKTLLFLKEIASAFKISDPVDFYLRTYERHFLK